MSSIGGSLKQSLGMVNAGHNTPATSIIRLMSLKPITKRYENSMENSHQSISCRSDNNTFLIKDELSHIGQILLHRDYKVGIV